MDPLSTPGTSSNETAGLQPPFVAPQRSHPAPSAHSFASAARPLGAGEVEGADRQTSASADATSRPGSLGVEQVRTRAAVALEGAAGRLSRFAERPIGESPVAERAGQVATRVAGGLTQAAHTLRSGDLEEWKSRVENQARSRPLRTVLSAIAAGFVVGRILR